MRKVWVRQRGEGEARETPPDGDGGVKPDREARMQMRGEKGGGRWRWKRNGTLISGLKRNAPPRPYTPRERRRRGRRGSTKEQQDGGNSSNTVTNLKSLMQLYDQLVQQRCEVALR